MTSKNLTILAAVALVMGGAAYFTTNGRRMKTPDLVGKRVVAQFDVGEAARVEIGGDKPLVLAADAAGWKIETLHGYPADVSKLRENLLKVKELKVGQVARGRKIEKPATVVVKDAAGKKIVDLALGGTHERKPKGEQAMYGGGMPDGRYVKLGDAVVLVADALDAFDGDAKKWCDTRIASVAAADVKSVVYEQGKARLALERKDGAWTMAGLGAKEEIDTSKTYSLDSALAYLDFADVADPAKDAEYGFATGGVYKATLKNGITYTAKVGGAKGSDRYVKLAAAYVAAGTNKTEIAACEKTAKDFNDKVGKWTYLVSSYSAESFLKTRKDVVKAKEEPKKEEPKKDATKKDATKKDAAKK